jgi:protein gp37
MAETTKIAWAHATNNFWIGCTKVGPGCFKCYAIPIAANMGIGWGDDAPRHRCEENYHKPLRWHAMHDRGQTHMIVKGKAEPVPLWIFPNSLSDFFDNKVPPAWRDDAWHVIRKTPLLCWIILSKRIPNVADMLPADWNGGRNYPHVGIVASVVDQKEFDRDLPRLVALKSQGVRWVGLSVEPQLGPISMADTADTRRLDWIIGGGESDQDEPARPYHLEWAVTLIEQCRALRVPFFMKQVGSTAFHRGARFRTKARAGTDADEWPPSLRVQQMPRIYEHEERRASQPTML